MTNKRISELTNITGSQVDDANDELPIVDASSNETKAITRAELMSSVSTMSITNDFTVDTDTLYVDSANNRVGIGTSSPDRALHVAGKATVRSGIALTDPDNPNTHLSVHDGSDSCFVSVRSGDVKKTGLLFGDSTDDFAGGFLYDNANDSLRIHSADYEAMRIDSSGNVGIGTSSPSSTVNVVYDSGTTNEWTNAGQGLTIQNTSTAKPASLKLVNAAVGQQIVWGGTAGDSYLAFNNYNTERMRIDSSGNLLVGRTNTGLNGTVGVYISDGGAIVAERNSTTLLLNRTASNGTLVDFNRSETKVGSITVTTSATSYNTSSDYRLKEDIKPVLNPSDRVLALNPVNFAWKTDGTRVDGFLAHEAQEVVPEAVTGEKDALDSEGNPEYQGIDQGKLVPLLTAALQDALQKIEALETRVTELEQGQ
jgi:hypothetical protein